MVKIYVRQGGCVLSYMLQPREIKYNIILSLGLGRPLPPCFGSFLKYQFFFLKASLRRLHRSQIFNDHDWRASSNIGISSKQPAIQSQVFFHDMVSSLSAPDRIKDILVKRDQIRCALTKDVFNQPIEILTPNICCILVSQHYIDGKYTGFDQEKITNYSKF